MVAAPAVAATDVAIARQGPVQEQQQPRDDDGGESYRGLLGLAGLPGPAGLGGRRRDTADHRQPGAAMGRWDLRRSARFRSAGGDRIGCTARR
jgi:hypothetical protein